MAIRNVYIAQGDHLPELSGVCTDSRGSAVAVDSGVSSIIFEMQHLASGSVISGTATAYPDGTVSYPWAAGDTDIPGVYQGKFIVTFSTGKKETFPNTRRNQLLINIEQVW